MPIYIEKGFKKATPTEHLINSSPFEWLAYYKPNEIKRKKDEPDSDYLIRLQSLKEKQEFFISGYIEPCGKNKWHRGSDDIIRRDLIVIDYDDIDTDINAFKECVKNKLPNTALMFYPSLRYTDNKPRMRVVIEPSRPLVKYEYEIIGLEIADKIGLPYDSSFITWTQLQGLPVITDLNKYQFLEVINGDKYPIPKNIEPPIKKNTAPTIRGVNSEVTHIPKEEALTIFADYISIDQENLYDYNNYLHAILVLAKAVQCNEIDYDTALICSEMLAMGNLDWIEGNREKLNKEVQNENIRTAYTFKWKFYDLFHKEPLQTMKAVLKELETQGELWRMEHEKVNEKTGEIKQVPVPPLTIANIIRKVVPIVMIGDISSKDRSLLYYYNFDTGLYVNSDIELKMFALKVEYSSTNRTWANVIEILKMYAPLVKPLEDRYLIPVQNGVYNLQTKQLEPFDPSYIITSKIATAYKNNAVKPTFWDVDKWLSSLACGDEEVVTLLWQLMNEAINPNHTRQKIGILYGQSGNNGKGTFQTLLINLIGRKNVSTLKPTEFNEKFKIAQLIGKVCNIGDDISDAYIDDISNLMSIATGDPITAEEKGKPAFSVYSKAFCLFSGNGLPRTRNKDGWGRRILIIPFNADFSGQVNDPKIKEQYVYDTDVLEYVLKKVLEMDFDKFIEPQAVIDEINEYQKHNDYIQAYVQDVYIENGYHTIARVPLVFIKEDIKEYFEREGINQHLPYGVGKDISNKLTKLTKNKYKIKRARIKICDLEKLPSRATSIVDTTKVQHIIEKK